MQDDQPIPEQTSHTEIPKERGKPASSLILSLFKRLYNFLGSLLTMLTITLIVLFTALVRLFLFTGEVSYILSYLVTACFLFIFIVSIYYLVVGVFGSIFIKRKGAEETRLVNANRMILRGIVGTVVLFLLYFVISVTALLLFAADIQGSYPGEYSYEHR